MTLLRSLRGQFVLLLLALALPVGGLGFVWVHNQDQELLDVREQSAGRSAERVAASLKGLELPTPAALVALETGGAEADLQDRCQKMATSLVSRVGLYQALTLYRGGQQLCSAARPDILDSRPAAISWMALGLTSADATGLLVPREPGGPITLATKASVGPSHAEWIVLRTIDRRALERVLAGGLSSEITGVALIDTAGNLVTERHNAGEGSRWLPDTSPRNLPAGAATLLAVRSRDGDLMRYAAYRVLDAGIVLVGLDPMMMDHPGFLKGRAAQILFIFVLTLAAAAWSSDRLFLRWIIALRDLAQRHSRDQSEARFIDSAGVPLECSLLGHAIDTLADNAHNQASFLNTVGAEKLKLLEELHHRVGNNFQVLESLLSLQRMMAAPVHKEDIRFIDEHLHAVAVAHRLSFSSDTSARADLERLVIEVANGLRISVELSALAVEFQLSWGSIQLSVDDAIVIALYMAATLPPYLDLAKAAGTKVVIRGEMLDDHILLAISGPVPPPEPAPFIRMRLANAYLLQLGGKLQSSEDPGAVVALIPRRRNTAKLSLQAAGD
jgi:two-component sensor histidine kinase